jgi:hypothetical protein
MSFAAIAVGGLVVGAVGTAVSAASAGDAAKAQADAAKKSGDLYKTETDAAMLRQLLAYYGKGAIPVLERSLSPGQFATLFGTKFGISDADIQSQLADKQNLEMELDRIGIDRTQLKKDASGKWVLKGTDGKPIYDVKKSKDLNIDPKKVLASIDKVNQYLESYGVDPTGNRGLKDAERQSMTTRRQEIEAWKNDPANFQRDSKGQIKYEKDGTTPKYIDKKKLEALVQEDKNIVQRFNQFGYDAAGVATGEFDKGRGELVGGSIDKEALGEGFLGQIKALNEEYVGKGKQMMSGYDEDTKRLLEKSQAMGLGLEQYGRGEEEKAKRESARSQTAANRMAASRLASSGLGQSTLMANQLAENERRASEGLQERLGAISDKRFGIGLGLQQDQLNLLSDRLTRRTGLEGSLIDREYQLKAAPISQEQALITSPAFNPYLNLDTTRFFSGASPSAASGAVWGQFMQGAGGQLAGLGASAAMRGMGSGSGSKYQTNVFGQSGPGIYGSDPTLIGPPQGP